MFPESRLIETSLTIRKMKRPETLTRSGTSRWLAIALGILGPKDSRETSAKILDAILWSDFHEGNGITAREISEKTGLGQKAVMYHLSRMKEIGLLEVRSGRYMVSRNFSGRPSLSKTREILESALDRIEAVLKEAERIYSSPE